MLVCDLMTPLTTALSPSASLCEAANALAQARVDQFPITHEGRLIGAVSQRDLVDYGLGRGLNADSPVFAVMSHYIDWCYEDESIGAVAGRMADADLESLIVLTRDHQLAGVIAASSAGSGSRTSWDDVELPSAA